MDYTTFGRTGLQHSRLALGPGNFGTGWAATHRAVPIIGPRTFAQIESNLGAAMLSLSAEQVRRLDAASALMDAPPRAAIHPVA